MRITVLICALAIAGVGLLFGIALDRQFSHAAQAPRDRIVPVASVAPEVCENDGSVRTVMLIKLDPHYPGAQYAVMCSDGIMKWVEK